MKVDIWSDVRCPFCYIGKHKFEKALADFPHKEKVDVQWHSFELDRSLKTDPSISALEHLAQSKGIKLEQVKMMTAHAESAAKEIGLTMNFEEGIVANSFNAHRLIQFAKQEAPNRVGEVEEALFKAHFVEGKNIDDNKVLSSIAKECGLSEDAVIQMLQSDEFSMDVKADEARAQQIGVQGVPFFIFNEKYAVSGAQQPDLFMEVLEKSWKEYNSIEKPEIILPKKEGDSCDIDGNCD